MSSYSWRGLNQNGKVRKGVLEADSPRALRRNLISRGITPFEVEEMAAKKSSPLFVRGISTKDLAGITRQIATLLAAGLTLEASLSTMIRQIGKSSQKNILFALHSRLADGLSFANSMTDIPHPLPDFYISSVAAGEKSGTLDQVLLKLSDYLTASYETAQKVIMAMIYPLIVTFVAFVVVVILLIFVVPDIVKVFESSGQELPLLTILLIKLSSFMVQWGWMLFLALAGGVIFLASILRKEAMKTRFHGLLLKLPLYGRLLKERAISRFIRTFGILLESRVDFVEAMSIAANVVTILPIKNKLKKASHDIREGQAVHEALETTGFFSPLVLNLVASGEKSGSLPQMLHYGAEHQERETMNTITVLVNVFEPVMILLMGGLVLLIVLAIMVPIFNMNTLI